MDQLNQVNIAETSTNYNIGLTYHSDMKCQNYDVKITANHGANGKISIGTNSGRPFVFCDSDPDRVIAIANMILSFAQMAKKNNQKGIDTNANA